MRSIRLPRAVSIGVLMPRSFSAWVQAVRTELGEPRDGRLLFIANPLAFRNAIEKTADVYDRYRMARRSEGISEVEHFAA